jgi:hypothetical protein
LIWLRESGNYLAPGGANDAALDISIYLRNWLSTLAVMLTLVFSLFLGANCLRFTLDACASHVGWWNTFEIMLADGAHSHLWWTPAVALPIVAAGVFLIPLGLAYWLT